MILYLRKRALIQADAHALLSMMMSTKKTFLSAKLQTTTLLKLEENHLERNGFRFYSSVPVIFLTVGLPR